MKFRNCLWIALSAVALSGCSSDSNFNTTAMTAAYNFGHLEKEGAPVAALLFNDTYFSGGLAAVQRPDFKLIAGDRLVLKYTGTLITLESSPGQTYIEGDELKDYYFVKTDIFEEKDTTAEAIKSKYNLRTKTSSSTTMDISPQSINTKGRTTTLPSTRKGSFPAPKVRIAWSN